MATTIKDVAKMAGVSISTVSRVINDSKPVSPDARRRVLRAIDVLQYEPNEIARSLVTRKSNLIGVIVEDIGLSYVSQVLRGVEEVGRMYDYDILVSSTYGDPEMEDRYIRVLLQKQVEGIVVISESNNENRHETLSNIKVPMAYLNRFYRNQDVVTFTIDNEEETKKLTDYLIEKGHRKIYYLGSNKDIEITVERYKQRGYEKAMEEIGEEPVVKMLHRKDENKFKETADKLIEDVKAGKVTALVVYSDEAAVELMNYFYDAGIKVPDDVSVVGMGDGLLAETYRPRLTTVKEPLYDYGAVSIRSIIKAIENKGKMPEEVVLLPAQIIERESVKEI